MHIIVDGYNLIRQSPYFKQIDRHDLQAGREALIDALAAYKRVKAFSITVVFDGKNAPLELARHDRIKGIELYYSAPGELADSVIKRMAGQHKQKLAVVSSDREVADYAARVGAAVISAAEFEDRLMMARMMEQKGGGEESTSNGWQPNTRKTGPSKRLPKRQRKMQQKISKL
ncbi:MAG: NYN domain-containing protein [Desulfobacteraceae bacterium]|nr:NYN domain-containing protein [Desulfobacteraceae bacterium]